MSASGGSRRKPPHVLVFPYPAQGHTLAILDLTHQLLLRDITITIITTPKNLPTFSALLSRHANVDTLIFPFPFHPLIPAGIENVRELGNAGNPVVIAALSKLYDPIIEWFSSHENPPVALISDFFLGWTTRLANQIKIPRFAFYSVGALLIAVNEYCWGNLEAVKKLDAVDFVGLPKTPSFKQEHLPSIFRLYNQSDPSWEIVKDGMLGNMETYGSIFNTFKALDGGYSDYLKGHHQRGYRVGPLSLLGLDGDPKSGPCDYVFDWLNGCPDKSVLYICFGSQKLMSKEQMVALGSALENSMARFIWVVKPSLTQQSEEGFGSVPNGFEDRVAGRGVVIKGWAPQVMLLSHRAVGGFLSHCGWNSILEAIVAEVMILAWPMEADQFVNARLLVEDMGVAVKACEGANTIPDSAQLAKLIARLSSENVPEKVRAKELRDEALAAVKEGGSSFCDLNGLVDEFFKLQPDEAHEP